MKQTGSQPRRRLAIVLTALFALAMVMGPGPGLLLVNPDIHDPSARYTIAGVPIIYAWGVFWYAVQVAVIVTAYLTLWRPTDRPSDRQD